MKNDYEIRGDITAIKINSPKYGMFETLISTSKLERVKEYPNSWHVRWDESKKSFIVQGRMPREKGKQKCVYLHRWIMNCPEGMQVDHINHDSLDNTDNNLRIVTQYENQQNMKGAKSSNLSSGILGVYWHKKSKRWQVLIQVNKVLKFIGYYNDIELAKKASIDARIKYMPFSQEAMKAVKA